MRTFLQPAAKDAEPVASGIVGDWDFVPSRPTIRRRLRALEGAIRRSALAPATRSIKPLYPSSTGWIAYLLYLPDGRAQPHHWYTLERLRAAGRRLCVVFASPDAAQIEPPLLAVADAAYWKALVGYDFSAYGLLLREMANRCPGSDIFVMNDSVFGPFADLRPLFSRFRWQLSGLTASSQVENHLQSCAFHLKEVQSSTVDALRSVFLPGLCLKDRSDVILFQETRLARVAARHLSVGSVWFESGSGDVDPTLRRPFELLALGYPFIKRSLLSKYSNLQDPDRILSVLQRHGHPHPAQPGTPLTPRPDGTLRFLDA